MLSILHADIGATHPTHPQWVCVEPYTWESAYYPVRVSLFSPPGGTQVSWVARDAEGAVVAKIATGTATAEIETALESLLYSIESDTQPAVLE